MHRARLCTACIASACASPPPPRNSRTKGAIPPASTTATCPCCVLRPVPCCAPLSRRTAATARA
eukprot:scaffold7207_cov62-Phaeocystis_antarctica.AAC.13